MAFERSDVSRAGRQTSAEELQQLLRQKRESISQQVEEIKMTMHTGIQDSKDKMKETLDWRLQMQRYPLAAVAGALAVGFLAGQVLGRAFSSDHDDFDSSTGRSFGAGTSLGNELGHSEFRPRRERHLVPPALKSKVTGRLEEVLSEIADNFFTEMSRVGQEVIVPTIVSNLTNAFTRERGSDSEMQSSYSPRSASETAGFSSTGSKGLAAGGPIGSSPDDRPGSTRFQGRGI